VHTCRCAGFLQGSCGAAAVRRGVGGGLVPRQRLSRQRIRLTVAAKRTEQITVAEWRAAYVDSGKQ